MSYGRETLNWGELCDNYMYRLRSLLSNMDIFINDVIG